MGKVPIVITEVTIGDGGLQRVIICTHAAMRRMGGRNGDGLNPERERSSGDL
jgi:hypothetical protein